MTNNFLPDRISILIGVFAVNLASWAADATRTPVEVTLAQPRRGEIHRLVTLPGTLRANQQATLYAKISGYLKSIAVDKGDFVRAGQPLAEIEVPELVADRAKYETEVRVAEIESRRVTVAQSNAPDLVTPQSVDDARGRLELARARLEHAETLLGFSRIAAPFDGVVTMRYVDAGAFVPAATAGASPRTAAIVTVMDFRTVRALVSVPEVEASRIRPGQPVRVTVEGLPGRVFEGAISRHGFALDEASRSLGIEADLPNPQLELRPGMYATARIGVEKHTDALLVPSAALVMEKANAFVYVAESGVARKKSIQAGFNDGANVEVLKGLTGSEVVILAGKVPLSDGAPIQTKEVQ